jgi:hypothetical protein
VKRLLARWLRRYADRIDYEGAPHAAGFSFTVEPGRGIVVHGHSSIRGRLVPSGQELPGCPVYSLGTDSWLRAHAEQIDRTAYIDPDTGQWRGVAR